MKELNEINELMARLINRLEIESMGLDVIREDIDRINKSLERTAELIKKEMETK